MSARYILEYAGAPVELENGIHLVDEQFATRFTCESDAWIAAHRERLTPGLVRVVNLHERHQKKSSSL